ncbi:MAG: leucine-rich repeat domain-containing protein [Candidatus Heimdallarchaeota archaeon]
MENTIVIAGNKYSTDYKIHEIRIKDIKIDNLEDANWGNLKEKLKIIIFENCIIESLTGICNLEHLFELRFWDCSINNNLNIEKCDKISRITITDCIIQKGSSLRLDVPNLQYLYIYRSKGFSNMEFLGDLPNLLTLVINHTSLDEITNLEKVTTLKKLNLKDNKITKLDGIEQIIEQNPQLKRIDLSQNPLKEAKDIDGILEWDCSGSRFTYKNLHQTLRFSLSWIDAPPKPKPRPAYETYEISEKATICRYCRKTIPPKSDHYVKHCILSESIYFNEKSLITEEKRHGRQAEITSTLYRQYYYYEIINLPGVHIPKLNGPLCESCSTSFRQEASKILRGLKTRVFKKEIYKSRVSIQKKFERMRKKWARKDTVNK